MITTPGGTLVAVPSSGDHPRWRSDCTPAVCSSHLLNGTATIGATGGVWSRMEFSGTQTLGGAGTVVFGDGLGPMLQRSEERRVGKEGRARGGRDSVDAAVPQGGYLTTGCSVRQLRG